MGTTTWYWPTANHSGGVDGSAMGKLFRGGELSDTALLAREAIQNSSDAHDRFMITNPDVPLRVVFRFVHLFRDEKQEMARALDLEGMRERRRQYDSDPLQPNSVLDKLDDPDIPLELLYVEDYGTHGLFGDPSTFLNSHLYKAMYYIGASGKEAGAGGSYGFGKSALQRASRTSSVIVHTAFESNEQDPVHSRLIGFTWWPDLQKGDTLYSGRGMFSDRQEAGPPDGPMPRPFTDSTADEIAAALGFQPRNPSRPWELGSSFLIVDPAVSAQELQDEVEKWWWPAFEDHKLDVEIVNPETGDIDVPRPASNPFVRQFLPAYRIATGLDHPTDPNHARLASRDWRNRGGSGGQDLGALGLVVPELALDGDGKEAERTSLVALIRGPRMVVNYAPVGQKRIPLRGAFVASDSANELLRETEPSMHDRWNKNASADVRQEATEAARAVLSKIQHSVSKMASDIAPPPPRVNRALGHFAKLMNGLMGTKRGQHRPSPSGGEPIELHFDKGRPTPEFVNDSAIRVRSRFSVRLAPNAPGSSCRVRVDCRLYVHEDDTRGLFRWKVALKPTGSQHGFERDEATGEWVGVITKDHKVTFEVESNPYPNLWSTSLQPSVERTSEWGSE